MDTYNLAVTRFSQFNIVYRLKGEDGAIFVVDYPPPRVPEKELLRFESVLGRPLPEDYRTFISEYSDACARESLILDIFSPGPFFGLRPNSGSSLELKWTDSRSVLPKWTLPICYDFGSGGLLCIEFADSSQGRIVSHCADDPVEVVADNFTQFLGSLEADGR